MLANYTHPDPVLMIGLLSFAAGIIAGIIIGQKVMTSSVKKMAGDDKATNADDPADWWKNGGDPYESLN